jgi:hypothetical protein
VKEDPAAASCSAAPVTDREARTEARPVTDLAGASDPAVTDRSTEDSNPAVETVTDRAAASDPEVTVRSTEDSSPDEATVTALEAASDPATGLPDSEAATAAADSAAITDQESGLPAAKEGTDRAAVTDRVAVTVRAGPGLPVARDRPGGTTTATSGPRKTAPCDWPTAAEL